VGRIENSAKIGLGLLALFLGGCAGKDQLVGSDGSGGGTATSGSVSYTFELLNFAPGECLPEPMQAEATCAVFTMRSGDACDCSEPGLTKTTAAVTNAARKQTELVGACGNGGPPCTDFCACEVPRATGTSQIECKTLPEPSADSVGWCYVSADAGEPQAELVADCPSDLRQRLRFVGDPSVYAGKPTFLACVDGPTPRPRGLGEVCALEFESDPKVRLSESKAIA